MSKGLRHFWGGVVLAAAGLSGCGESGPPQFSLDMRQIVANRIVPEHQRQIAGVLREMFGTPDKPLAPRETGLDVEKLRVAAGLVWGDQQGDQHGLYRRHCAYCHGVSGDGQGPTAMVLNPYPRDFRPGVFKFKSTYSADCPTDGDLRSILEKGIPGTSMPAFALLAPDELDVLVQYVKYLSMRGQMETALVSYVAKTLDFDPLTGTTGDPLDPAHNADQRDAVHSMLDEDVMEEWKDAPDDIVNPDPKTIPGEDGSPDRIAASIERGRQLFVVAACTTCHGPLGRGDGQQISEDVWNMANRRFIDDTEALAARLSARAEAARIDAIGGNVPNGGKGAPGDARSGLDGQIRELAERREVVATLLPPRYALPRNLQRGVYRGGGQPLDLFRRVHQGVPGTPMPGCGPASPGARGTLTEERIWWLVDYVRSLPNEPTGRNKE
jgi:mono/diheme cytochrome c family protein